MTSRRDQGLDTASFPVQIWPRNEPMKLYMSPVWNSLEGGSVVVTTGSSSLDGVTAEEDDDEDDDDANDDARPLTLGLSFVASDSVPPRTVFT